jgi:alkylation response protein AidB-like acyl-CoA dehydrogenase
MSQPEAQLIDNKNRTNEEDASIAVAETNRELDWKSKSFIASLYMGELDPGMCYPFPEQDPADKAAADELIAKIHAWASEHVDGEAIDRTGIIPAHVFKGCQDLGLFAIKIPTEYGGLGLSQTNYMRILSAVAEHCGSTAATLSAHQSIGVPQPLKLFGTEEQKKKYLPRFAEGEISAFGLTESSVGSDPANMATVAELDEEGEHWILNGEKLWCTNGVIADVIVVMAKTGVDKRGSREINRISAFIVETKWAGVEVMHRCEFMGIRAIENGIIRFTDVKIPKENLIWGEGKGLRLALTTLNDGRLGIPAITAASVRQLAAFSARWAKSRYQWGKYVGEHEAGADKLARIAAGGYAMETLSAFCASMSDRKDVDIRMEAAGAKLFNTELCWQLVDEGLQLRGGRGFETATSLEARGEVSFPLERGLRDARINRIVEGTSDIMHLFLAREALDKHLRLAGGLFNKRATLGQKLQTVLKAAGFYASWYPRLWVGGLFASFPGFNAGLASHMKYVDRQGRCLARTLFHAMALNGPKLEMKQLTLARIVDIGVELAVMALVASRAQTALNRGDNAELPLAEYYLGWGRERVDLLFRELKKNNDKAAVKLSKHLMATSEALPEARGSQDLVPMPREFGSDLTSGRQTERLAHGGKAPATKRAAKAS